MAQGLLITGASGFLGRRLLSRLDGTRWQRVRVLWRSAAEPGGGVEAVRGDLLEPHRWADALAGCDTVLHMAAATGKHRRQEYFRVNCTGTKQLLAECRKAGVKRFLHISTIAVQFQDQAYYYYAQSKAEAEKAVAASGLRYLIVRPTMIFGHGSPVLDGLRRLARAPRVCVFGRGMVRVQPLDVDDLAAYLLWALESDAFADRVVACGGPDIVTMEELLLEIRRRVDGKPGRVVHLPVGWVRPALAAIEPLLLPLMPVTAGQLASFLNDGVAEPNAMLEAPLAPLKTLRQMLGD